MSVKNYDPSDPGDLATLVATGLIWNPAVAAEYKDMAVDALAEGSVDWNEKVPADALAEVNRLRDAMGREPIGPTSEAPTAPSA